jgi:hypothetical protein
MPLEMDPKFTELIERLVKRYGNAQRLAAALGMTLSAFQRGRAQGTYNTENCLRLAAETGEPPSEVLRAAGKGKIADLIESLYGQSTVSPAGRQLLDRWATLTPKSRDTLTALMKQLIGDAHDGGEQVEPTAIVKGGDRIPVKRRGRSPLSQ